MYLDMDRRTFCLYSAVLHQREHHRLANWVIDLNSKHTFMPERLIWIGKLSHVSQNWSMFDDPPKDDRWLVMPAKLLVNRSGEVGVFLNVNGVAAWRPVALGLRSQDAVEVLDGLHAKDLVITPRDQRNSLSDGKRVVNP